MLVRLWRTRFDRSEKAKLTRYANTRSLPILSSRSGNRGVMFFSDGDEWVTLTLWDSHDSIAALDRDREYLGIVEGIIGLGVLTGRQATTVFEWEGGAMANSLSAS